VLQRRHRLQHLRSPRARPAAVSRIVTVAGNVAQPRNYEVLIGTPMDHLVRLAGPAPTPTATSWAAR
jgi:electron transport complex protein RnfC